MTIPEDTRDVDVDGPGLPIVLGDLDPGQLGHPVLVLAPPDCAPSKAEPAHRLAMRLEALAAWPVLALATVHVLTLRPGRRSVGVGRASGGAELEIDSPTLSRRHGEIGHDGGRWYVADFESSNGTFVEELRLPPNVPAALMSGDLLRLGTHAVIFLEPDALKKLLRRDSTAARPLREAATFVTPSSTVHVTLTTPAVDAATAGGGEARALAGRASSMASPGLLLPPEGVPLREFAELLSTSGQRLADIPTPFVLQVPTAETPGPTSAAPDARTDHPTRPIPYEELRRLRRGRGLGGARLHAIQGARVVVGRGAGADLLLPSEASASRKHAVLTAGASGWGVTDLDSRNGTFVNGRRVPPGVVVPVKDEFQLWFGGYRAVFLSAAQLERLLAGA